MIPKELEFSDFVTQKVVAPAILYSAIKTHFEGAESDKVAPRMLFQKLAEVFKQQVLKPTLKYTQNETPDKKLQNELQCLLEAQRFCYLTNFSSGVLCNFFQVFYDSEIVCEDTYYLWRDCDTSAWGKDVALKEVQSFLAFLERGDDDEVEEEPSSNSNNPITTPITATATANNSSVSNGGINTNGGNPAASSSTTATLTGCDTLTESLPSSPPLPSSEEANNLAAAAAGNATSSTIAAATSLPLDPTEN
jgi:hypothetical protein